DQARRRVIAARRLALAAAHGRELEAARAEVDLRLELEQRLVDAAELLGAEVPEVDRTERAVAGVEGERAERVEQRTVRERRLRERGHRLWRPEEAAERGQRELGATVVGLELRHRETQRLVQVGVRAAATAPGQAA